MAHDCVIQDWVQKLTWKEQSALLTAIRGNDQTFSPSVRALVRWVRRMTLYDADINGVFVKYKTLPDERELKSSIEYMTVHFVSHLMHALQIIGYKANSETTRNVGFNYYRTICQILHCEVESEEDMNKRLLDNREEIN